MLAAERETEQHGARFLLVTISTPASVYPDPQMRARYEKSLGVTSLFYPEQRLERLGEQAHFEVVALAPDMQKRAEAGGVYYHGFSNTKPGFGHWNEAGHAAAAELIAERLCRAQ